MSIINEEEISLNGVVYPIKGSVSPQSIPRFPPSMRIGAPEFANQQDISSWTINDQRGGIGIEEMDESLHANRSYFSNCNTGFKGHICLAPLATEATLPSMTDVTLTITNGDMELNSDWTTGAGNAAQSTAQAHGGTYSWLVGGAGATSHAYQNIAGAGTTYKGKAYTFLCYVWCDTATTARIGIDDGVGGVPTISYSVDYHAGSSAWVQMTVTKKISASATYLRLVMDNIEPSVAAHFDDATIVCPTLGTPLEPVHYVSKLWWAIGNTLVSLNTGGTGFDYVYSFPATITALVASGAYLFIFLGDSDEYWYMSGDATTFLELTTSSAQNAKLGVDWGGVLQKMNAAGQLAYCAAPQTNPPVWTNNGSLVSNGLPSGACTSLITSSDEDGASVIKAGTKDGLFQHDYTLASFLSTPVKLGNHPNGGKGCVHWNGYDWVSAGTLIKKYRPSTGEVTEGGLDQDDGLPQEYAGETMKLVDGIQNLYALVDASQTTGLGYSALYSKNYAGGWQCLWDASSLDTWAYSFASASGTGWTNLANAYDNNTATYASSPSIAASAWSAYAIYVIAATSSRRLKFYASSNGVGTVNEIDLDVSTDGSTWVDVFNGEFTADTWTHYGFALGSYINVRVRFKNTGTVAGIGYLKEIQILSASVDGTMHSAIVSSAYSYRLYFDHADKIYSIERERNNISPAKTSGYTYAAAGLHVSPWFDGGTAVFSKLQDSLNVFCDGMSSTENIRVLYRTDHSYTDLFSGWNILDTITEDGTTAFTFGSNIGVVFKSIQFGFELVRGTTTTLSPVLLAATSSYDRNGASRWGWSFTVQLKLGSREKTARQLEAALKTAAELETKMEFIFRDSVSDTTEIHYVRLMPFNGQTPTGPNYDGEYNLTVIEISEPVTSTSVVISELPTDAVFRIAASNSSARSRAEAHLIYKEDTGIQTAIDALPTNTISGRGQIQFAEGDYNIPAALVLPEYVHLKGRGHRATHLKFTGTKGLEADGVDTFLNKIVIEDMSIVGSTAAGTIGIEFLYTTDATFRSVEVNGFEKGTYLESSLFPKFYDCFTQGCKTYALHLNGVTGFASYECLWTGGDAATVITDEVVSIRNSKDGRIIGGWICNRKTAGDGEYCILLGETRNFTVRGVYFEDSNTAAVLIMSGNAGQWSEANHIEECDFYEVAAGDGIHLGDCSTHNFILKNWFPSGTITNAIHALVGSTVHNFARDNVSTAPVFILDDTVGDVGITDLGNY